MKAEEFYELADSHGIDYVSNCTCISQREWEQLMKGAKKANATKIEKLIKEQYNDLYRMFGLDIPGCYNPYRSSAKRTDTHLIYVHSGIEYFFKLNKL